MLVWQECLHSGAEGHAFWTVVRMDGSSLRLVEAGRPDRSWIRQNSYHCQCHLEDLW